jgi:hypothetical protein
LMSSWGMGTMTRGSGLAGLAIMVGIERRGQRIVKVSSMRAA